MSGTKRGEECVELGAGGVACNNCALIFGLMAEATLSFKQHINEKDPERVEQIIRRAYEDAEWVLKKYLGSQKT
nr:unnamed protein product [Callosobruchus chinensis]